MTTPLKITKNFLHYCVDQHDETKIDNDEWSTCAVGTFYRSIGFNPDFYADTYLLKYLDKFYPNIYRKLADGIHKTYGQLKNDCDFKDACNELDIKPENTMKTETIELITVPEALDVMNTVGKLTKNPKAAMEVITALAVKNPRLFLELSGVVSTTALLELIAPFFPVTGTPRVVNAVKAVREATGWGLRESKDFVDNNRQDKN